jgi:transcriptional regulator with XRE-family HTH domain
VTPLDHVVHIGRLLDSLGVPWVLGGSLASSIVGEPRSTMDIDVAVALDPAVVGDLVAAVAEEYYVSEDMVRDAVARHSSFNLIHFATGMKVDVFPLSVDPLDVLADEPRADIVIWHLHPNDVSNTIRFMLFAETLLEVRTAAGLTQAELSARSGIARPNIAAFEAGRRNPRWDTATRTLEAAGSIVEVSEPIMWSWTTGRRPYAVPSRLWRLSLREAFRILTPGIHLWWSGPVLRLDLADRPDRARAYELVLREGSPDDIRSTVDGALLIDTWPDLVLPAELRRAWQPVIDQSHPALAAAS